MGALGFLLVLAAADPDVTRVIAEVATTKGEARAHAVNGYIAGCRGKNRFAFKNNQGALEALRPMFADEDPQVRIAALGLTLCYGKDVFEQEILSLTDDQNDDVRERAFEEAAHAGTASMAAGLAPIVEQCGGKIRDLDDKKSKWCVMATYALGENGHTFREKELKKRVADLSAPLVAAPSAKLREHAMRNLDLCGSAEHADALRPVLDGDVAPGGQPVNDAERKKAKELVKKLKKRKA